MTIALLFLGFGALGYGGWRIWQRLGELLEFASSIHALSTWTNVLVTPKPRVPSETAIMDAIEGAFQDCGLNPELLSDDFDVLSTGKLGDVLYHATKRLGKEAKTVRDLHDWIKDEFK
jgi:hypothetical protein